MGDRSDNEKGREESHSDMRVRRPVLKGYDFASYTSAGPGRAPADRRITLPEVMTVTIYRDGLPSEAQSEQEESDERGVQSTDLALAAARIETGIDFHLVRHHCTFSPAQPPAYGERLLYLVLSKEERENLIGDLAEEYAQLRARHGAKFAKIWYWKQVCGSVLSLAPRAIRWGLLASAVEWVRRHI